MALLQISIGGFQSFRDPVVVDLHPQVTLIAGPNDVGKSALLRVLRLGAEQQNGFHDGRATLSHLWQVPRQDVLNALSPVFQREQPNPQELAILRRGLEQAADPQQVEVSYEVRAAPQAGLGQFNVSRVALPLVGMETRRDQPEYWAGGPASGTSYGVDEWTQLARALAKRVYHVLPRRPTAGPQGIRQTPDLLPSAENLTSVVTLTLLNDRTGKFAQLEELVRRAFPGITSIGLEPGVNVGAELSGELQIEYQHGRKVPLTQCGTGIEQIIALGLAVLLHQEPQLILIDEPSSYLHPAAERVLIDFLNQHREHQYVIATHSPVFLNAFPITQAVLLTKDESGQTHASAATAANILEEVGLRAGDLWLNNRRVWVEGDSEVDAAMALATAGAIDRDVVGVVRALPNHGLLLAKPEAQLKMVDAIAESVSDLPTEQWFVFDADERSEEEKQRIRDAANGKIVFLPVRELENCFLSAGAIAVRLREINDSDHPSDEVVEKRLAELRAATSDEKLYPSGPASGPNAIVGNRVLKCLYWELATAEYRKRQEAPILAPLVWAESPELLEPFVQALASGT